MDELLREVQAEKEYLLDTFRALNEALQRKEKTVMLELSHMHNIGSKHNIVLKYLSVL